MIVSMLCKGCLILAVAWVATALMHKQSPSQRNGVWTIAFALLLALPLLGFCLPAWKIIPSLSSKTELEIEQYNSFLRSTPTKRGNGKPTHAKTKLVGEFTNLKPTSQLNRRKSTNKVSDTFEQPVSKAASAVELSGKNDPVMAASFFNKLPNLETILVTIWAAGFVALILRLLLSAILLRRQESQSSVTLLAIGSDEENL